MSKPKEESDWTYVICLSSFFGFGFCIEIIFLLLWSLMVQKY